MSEITQKFDDLIEQSNLSPEERSAMLDFFADSTEQDIENIYTTVHSNPEMITNLWRTLYTKIVFLKLLTVVDTISTEAKENITREVSEMNDEEFAIFLQTLTGVEDVESKMREVVASYTKIHAEIINSIQELSKKS